MRLFEGFFRGEGCSKVFQRKSFRSECSPMENLWKIMKKFYGYSNLSFLSKEHTVGNGPALSNACRAKKEVSKHNKKTSQNETVEKNVEDSCHISSNMFQAKTQNCILEFHRFLWCFTHTQFMF